MTIFRDISVILLNHKPWVAWVRTYPNIFLFLNSPLLVPEYVYPCVVLLCSNSSFVCMLLPFKFNFLIFVELLLQFMKKDDLLLPFQKVETNLLTIAWTLLGTANCNTSRFRETIIIRNSQLGMIIEMTIGRLSLELFDLIGKLIHKQISHKR